MSELEELALSREYERILYHAEKEGKRDYAEWKARKNDGVHNATDKETTE